MLAVALLLLVAPLFYGTVASSANTDSAVWIALPPIAVFFAAIFGREIRSGLLAVLGFWLVYLVLQLSISEYPYLSALESLTLAGWVSTFLIAYIAVKFSGAKILAKIGALAGVLPSLWGLFVHIGHERGNPYYTGLAGTFGLHNPFAGFLLMTIPLAAYCLWADKARPFVRVLWTAALLIQLTAFILTRSRAAWLVAIIVIAVYALSPVFKSKWGRAAKLALTAVSILAVAAFLFALLPPEWLFEKYRARFELLDYSLKGRYEFWRAGLLIFLDEPIFGTGAGTFQNAYTRYQQSIVFYSTDPHSYPLRVAAGQGAVGLAFLISSAVLVWRRFNRWIGKDATGIARAAGFAAAGIFIHSAVDFDLTIGPNAWMLMALAAMAASQGGGDTDVGKRFKGLAGALRFHAPVVAATALMLAWGVCTLYGRTPWVYPEARIKSPLPPSKIAMEAPFAAVQVFEKAYDAAVRKTDGDSDSYLVPNKLIDRVRTFTERSPRVAPAWFLRGVIVWRQFDSAGSASEFTKKAIALDPHNYPEYYALLASVLEESGKSDESYEVLKECLLEKIPIVEPVYPEHVKPTWQEKNMLFATMWRQLAEYEAVFGDAEKADEYDIRAESFYEYIKEHG